MLEPFGVTTPWAGKDKLLVGPVFGQFDQAFHVLVGCHPPNVEQVGLIFELADGRLWFGGQRIHTVVNADRRRPESRVLLQVREHMVTDANYFIGAFQEPDLFSQGSPARESLLRVDHVEVMQGRDAMARAQWCAMSNVLVQLVPHIEAVRLPVKVLLARLSRQVGNVIAEDAMPLLRQVQMHLQAKILAPRFRKCCDVKTMLPGKFAQAVMKVPDVAKADADVSEMC